MKGCNVTLTRVGFGERARSPSPFSRAVQQRCFLRRRARSSLPWFKGQGRRTVFPARLRPDGLLYSEPISRLSCSTCRIAVLHGCTLNIRAMGSRGFKKSLQSFLASPLGSILHQSLIGCLGFTILLVTILAPCRLFLTGCIQGEK